MFQYHCLNPIAEKGLKLFGDNYKIFRLRSMQRRGLLYSTRLELTQTA